MWSEEVSAWICGLGMSSCGGEEDSEPPGSPIIPYQGSGDGGGVSVTVSFRF